MSNKVATAVTWVHCRVMATPKGWCQSSMLTLLLAFLFIFNLCMMSTPVRDLIDKSMSWHPPLPPPHTQPAIQWRWGSPMGFGEQGNIGKISRGTREHEPIFREQGTELYKLEDENMVSKFIERGANKENMWEHGSIGQFWKGTRELRPLMGDPRRWEKERMIPEWKGYVLSFCPIFQKALPFFIRVSQSVTLGNWYVTIII